MGEAKRRERAMATGILVAPRRKKNVAIERKLYEVRESFNYYLAKFQNDDLRLASLKVPMVAEAWFHIVAFTESVRFGDITLKEVKEFWGAYWENELPKALGQVDIRWKETWYFLTRIKGAALASTEFMVATYGSRCTPSFLEDACSQYITVGESTLEIGLAYPENNVIYWGENLLVHKGHDTKELQGELMIAVRHSTNCWNYYPSPNNYHVSLSDYKLARSALEQYPLSIKGELMHSQSGKIARLLGMRIEDNYAYLVRRRPVERSSEFMLSTKSRT